MTPDHHRALAADQQRAILAHQQRMVALVVDQVLDDRSIAHSVLEAAGHEIKHLIAVLDDRSTEECGMECDGAWAMLSKICGVIGHTMVDDQCGRPEHRMCELCDVVVPDAPLGPGFRVWESCQYSEDMMCDYPGCTNRPTANRWDGEVDRCPDHITADGR